MVYVLATESNETTAELLTAAQNWVENAPASEWVRAVWVIPGPDVIDDDTIADKVRFMATYGAHEVLIMYVNEVTPVLGAVDNLATLAKENPAPIIVAANPKGTEIAARLAVRLNSGYLADVTGLNPDRSGGFAASGSIFGDVYELTTVVVGPSPIVALRPGSVPAVEHPVDTEVREMVAFADSAEDTAPDARVISFTPAVKQARPHLAQAKVVVGGGRGVGSAEAFTELVEPLADLFGGAVGVTRDVVDEDWYLGTYQIGQTGVSISPELYINLGISGAIQHTVGVVTSGTIVTINNDEDAEIFDISDFGVVGDLHEIVPALFDELRSRM